MNFLLDYWWVLILIIILFAGLKTINQGTVAVVTIFGKYQSFVPGLRLMIPFVEQIYKRISIQNRSIEMEFQAVTLPISQCVF